MSCFLSSGESNWNTPHTYKPNTHINTHTHVCTCVVPAILQTRTREAHIRPAICMDFWCLHWLTFSLRNTHKFTQTNDQDHINGSNSRGNSHLSIKKISPQIPPTKASAIFMFHFLNPTHPTQTRATDIPQ